MSQSEREIMSRIFSEVSKTLMKENPGEKEKDDVILAGISVVAQFSYDINRIADALEERNRLATIEAKNGEGIESALNRLHETYHHRG